MAYTQTHTPVFHSAVETVKAFFVGLAQRAAAASDRRAAIIGAQIEHLKSLDDAELASRGIRRDDIEVQVFRSNGLI